MHRCARTTYCVDLASHQSISITTCIVGSHAQAAAKLEPTADRSPYRSLARQLADRLSKLRSWLAPGRVGDFPEQRSPRVATNLLRALQDLGMKARALAFRCCFALLATPLCFVVLSGTVCCRLRAKAAFDYRLCAPVAFVLACLQGFYWLPPACKRNCLLSSACTDALNSAACVRSLRCRLRAAAVRLLAPWQGALQPYSVTLSTACD